MDWNDIILHALIAVGAVCSLCSVLPKGAWLIAGVNSVVWPARELYQHPNNPLAIFAHPQSLLEWTVPVALGLLFLAILGDKDA